MHVIPVLLGGGTPLFGRLDSAITLERTQVLATPAATHLGFRVVWKAAAGGDQARRIQGRADGAPADQLNTYLPRRADDPFYTFGGTFAGSAGRSRSSGVITRTGA
jgi:hypothetical protein